MKDFCPKGTHKKRNLPAPKKRVGRFFFYDYAMHEVTPSVVPMAVRIAISV